MNKVTTLLYVDDEPINLRIFEINFKNKYNVLTAESGHEGLEMLKSEPGVTIVISDKRMPGMDGLEFIQQAKVQFPNVIFFILTGYDITDEIVTALKESLINRYFKKPFNIKEIDHAICEALKMQSI